MKSLALIIILYRRWIAAFEGLETRETQHRFPYAAITQRAKIDFVQFVPFDFAFAETLKLKTKKKLWQFDIHIWIGRSERRASVDFQTVGDLWRLSLSRRVILSMQTWLGVHNRVYCLFLRRSPEYFAYKHQSGPDLKSTNPAIYHTISRVYCYWLLEYDFQSEECSARSQQMQKKITCRRWKRSTRVELPGILLFSWT